MYLALGSIPTTEGTRVMAASRNHLRSQSGCSLDTESINTMTSQRLELQGLHFCLEIIHAGWAGSAHL